jgi:hypothetical protein
MYHRGRQSSCGRSAEVGRLELEQHEKDRRSKKISSVYSKLQAWWWLTGEAEVAVMLDTDLCVGKLLTLLYSFSNTSRLRVLSEASILSVWTRDRLRRGGGGGGINGGVVFYRPSADVAHQMLQDLKTYVPPDNSGGEQDFLSQYFGLKEEIAQLGVALNFQVHQLALTAGHDDDEGRWLSLVDLRDEIACFHFSALPNRVKQRRAVDGCGKSLKLLLTTNIFKTVPLRWPRRSTTITLRDQVGEQVLTPRSHATDEYIYE